MIGIKYISPADNSGYGVAAKAYVKGLVRHGAAVRWVPLVKGSSPGLGYEPASAIEPDDEELSAAFHAKTPYQSVIIHAVPEYIPYFYSREPDKNWIGFIAWETDVIPRHWPALLNKLYCVLTPSEFSRKAFIRGGVSCPVYVVPHIASRHQAAGDIFPAIDPECFVFYTIAEWIPRKACALTIEAYLRAFCAADRCMMIVKTSAYDLALSRWKKPFRTVDRQIAKMASRCKRPAKIVLIDENISDERIHALHRSGNCFVSLTRGEGWGLAAFEAAAAGNPVVITGYGGQTEYFPDDYPYLVRHTVVPVQSNPRWSSYEALQRWAEPDLDDAVRIMRHIARRPQEARQAGAALKSRVNELYNQDVVIGRLIALLERF